MPKMKKARIFSELLFQSDHFNKISDCDKYSKNNSSNIDKRTIELSNVTCAVCVLCSKKVCASCFFFSSY